MFEVLFAQDPAKQPEIPFYLNPMFLMVVMGLFWVVIILPKTRRQRLEQQTLLQSVKRGAKVLTTSGIVGTVVGAKEGEDEIVIRSEDSKLRIKRSTIAQVLGSDEVEANK